MGHGFDGSNGLRRPEPLAADDKDGFPSNAFCFTIAGKIRIDLLDPSNPCPIHL